jgi:hypothetical protein
MTKLYYVRFNVQHGPNNMMWKVIDNGVVHLVQNVNINVPSWGEMTMEDNNDKWNIACRGYLTIDNMTAYIDDYDKRGI